ncbi:MAG: carboxylesterase family protein [Gemmatimonadetes bacterium]|nr:carboxylesterase family protein [Gemmatimonadota bacterium]
MRHPLCVSVLCVLVASATLQPLQAQSASSTGGDRVRTGDGLVEGITLPSGIHAFRGIPYAAPPVRDLRWKPPQPVTPWTGVRPAGRFAAQCMQMRVFDDMVFRNSGVSEDCLYVNVWTPSTANGSKLPVLVYFYGGGFVGGDGSEYRYDGESLAERGIVVVTMSYRLGVFGFLAHPELTAESAHHASGNYALLDQVASLRWVKSNIAAFGGDPEKVTVGGESAGSVSVSALMASPLATGLFRGAIGESGSLLGTLSPVPLALAEENGASLARFVGASSLAELRNMPAMELLLAASRRGAPRSGLDVDGYFLPKPAQEVFAAGEQAHVPLLVGWNSQEAGPGSLVGSQDLTSGTYAAAVRRLYGDDAPAVLALYPDSTDAMARESATALASDRFIALSTWKWAEMQRLTGDAPVYRYYFARPRPRTAEGINGPMPLPRGAVHSAEIEYALGNLATNPVYAWTSDDYEVSRTMEGYFANFIKTGDPNGTGLPEWPQAGTDPQAPMMLMRIDVRPRAEAAPHRDRYVLLERLGG